MRHGFAKRRLNRTTSHRKAMFRAMSCSLIECEQIRTTIQKAKELRPIVERLITRARSGSLAARRISIARLQSEKVVKKLFDDIAPRFLNRPGGYTRIIKAGSRYGDAASMAVIEFVERRSNPCASKSKKQDDEEEAL
ncbi:MAG: 50S ribosomal protein L17 [Holosporales bacterium]|jgi:large subunit ribosomal protein L17|nr:50S ribosomal protein L17 [Holosporales bacterium]